MIVIVIDAHAGMRVMAMVMTQDEIRHHLLSGRGEGPGTEDSWKSPRDGQIMWAYVVEVSMTLARTNVEHILT